MRSPCPDIYFLEVADPAKLQTSGLSASLAQYQPPTTEGTRRGNKAKAEANSDCSENRNESKMRGLFHVLLSLSPFFLSLAVQLCQHTI